MSNVSIGIAFVTVKKTVAPTIQMRVAIVSLHVKIHHVNNGVFDHPMGQFVHATMAISLTMIKKPAKILMNATMAAFRVHNCVKIRWARFNALVSVALR